MDKNVDRVVNKVLDAAVVARCHGACLPLSIILKDQLESAGYKADVINGLRILNANQGACWHCWVRLDGHDIDISTKVMDTLLKSGAFGPSMRALDLSSRVTEDWKTPCQRMDMDDRQEIEQIVTNMGLLGVYRADPQKFWDGAPSHLRAFREHCSQEL